MFRHFKPTAFGLSTVAVDLTSSANLAFACPLIRFSFDEYLQQVLGYEVYEYEHLDWLYAEFVEIHQS